MRIKEATRKKEQEEARRKWIEDYINADPEFSDFNGQLEAIRGKMGKPDCGMAETERKK